MMSSQYARALLKVSVGQILQTIGFQSVQSTAMDVLVDILERYIMLMTRSAHDYAELGLIARVCPSSSCVVDLFIVLFELTR
jgi:hypothetical protein